MNQPVKPEVKSPDAIKQELEQQFGINTANLMVANAEVNEINEVAEARALEEQFVNRIEDEIKKEQLKRIRADNLARRKFSTSIFTVTVLWMLAVLIVTILCGYNRLKLSDGVLIALITTTTANVFGFFYVVVNYLFNKEKST